MFWCLWEGMRIGKGRMSRSWQRSSWEAEKLPLAAATSATSPAACSHRCWWWITKPPGGGWRLTWTAVPAHLTDGVTFSVFFYGSTWLDFGAQWVQCRSLPSPIITIQSSVTKFLQEKQRYIMSSSVISSLFSCMLLRGGSHWEGSEPLLFSVLLWQTRMSSALSIKSV